MASSNNKGFTMIELLISILLLSIFITILVISINPQKTFEKSRDAARFNDLQSLSLAISTILKQNPQISLGVTNTIYLSLVKIQSATCSDYQLPIVTSGYSYNCVATPTNINGTGWIPIDFTLNPIFNLKNLPIDPLNSGEYFYSYKFKNKLYKFSTKFENERNLQISYYDGGVDPLSYEIGNNLSLYSPENGLVIRYTFEENTGTIAYDSSGFNFNATLNNFNFNSSSGWIAGKVGKGLIFDGIDDYLSINYSYQTSNLKNLTVCLWLNSTSTINSSLISFNTSSYWGLEMNSSGKINFYTKGSDGSLDLLTSKTSINDGQWHFICGTYSAISGVNKYIYIDGKVDIPKSANNGSNLGDNSLASGVIGQNFNGLIDEILIYHKVFKPQEINQLYLLQR